MLCWFHFLFSEEHTTTDSTDRGKKVAIADNLSNRDLTVSSLSIGTVILLLGISHLVRKYRKLKRTTQTSDSHDVEIQHENEIEEESQSVYDEIDETLVIENAIRVPVVSNISLSNTNTLETQGHHGSLTEKSRSESGDSDGYLFPCISTLDITNDDICSHSDSDSSDTADFKFEQTYEEDYLNPYHTLNQDDRPISLHNYEKTSVQAHSLEVPSTFYDKKNTHSQCHERGDDMSD
ncbi:Hypothetical predicted protein [Mytilus galloprovincialis]|uniref:Uncharacterized protein n=1 Tax=Mytilus galloprovincialis TaxID=29158 RepID=A0A8B6E9E7_MYTGA|nr:Hypothetical predicted protein [Mytilus galloprovincialis]